VEFSRRSKESPSRLRVGIRPTDARLPTVLTWANRHKNTAPLVLDPTLPGGRRELEFAEAARLQGFPDNYVFCGALTSAWRQVADAIQIDLGRAICQAICEDK
jgi:site-specific DNA-cytosine methylase